MSWHVGASLWAPGAAWCEMRGRASPMCQLGQWSWSWRNFRGNRWIWNDKRERGMIISSRRGSSAVPSPEGRIIEWHFCGVGEWAAGGLHDIREVKGQPAFLGGWPGWWGAPWAPDSTAGHMFTATKSIILLFSVQGATAGNL